MRAPGACTRLAPIGMDKYFIWHIFLSNSRSMQGLFVLPKVKFTVNKFWVRYSLDKFFFFLLLVYIIVKLKFFLVLCTVCLMKSKWYKSLRFLIITILLIFFCLFFFVVEFSLDGRKSIIIFWRFEFRLRLN